MTLYDTIGHGYRRVRQPDARIAARILGALGNCASVVNVGAGTGSYEPTDRPVVALEPSRVMIRQRPPGAAPVVCGVAEALPFRDRSFDASMASLTLHHWKDVAQGLREMQRVARRVVVILTFDPEIPDPWIYDYFPEMLGLDRSSLPTMAQMRQWLGRQIQIQPVPIPHDCRDGFLGAYWRRPEAFLDPDIRAAISIFSKLHRLEEGLAKLRQDLDTGAWHERYSALLDHEELDLGYRLIVSRVESF